MRTRNTPLDNRNKDWYEKKCGFMHCTNPTFYTDNIKAKYCCDPHKYKSYILKNLKVNIALKKFNNEFKKNDIALGHLLRLKIIRPRRRDLRIAEYNPSIRTKEIMIDGESALNYFENTIIIKKDGTLGIRKIEIQNKLCFIKK